MVKLIININIQDYSNYSKNHPKYNESRKNQLGYLKNETEGLILKEFVGLKSKTYCIHIDQTKPIVKCKGIQSSYLNKHMRLNQFKEVLLTSKQMTATFKNLKATNHRMYLTQFKKSSLNAFDSKRWILHCGIHSRPFGHVNKNPRCRICNK